MSMFTFLSASVVAVFALFPKASAKLGPFSLPTKYSERFFLKNFPKFSYVVDCEKYKQLLINVK